MKSNFTKRIMRLFFLGIISMVIPSLIYAETVGIFYDSSNEQIKFAASDVKAALEAKSFTVEMLPLSSLAATYSNKKIIIALSSDTAVSSALTTQGGTLPASLGEQAYGLRTTVAPERAYWVLGGDVNGAMYGGLQIAENIKFNGFSGTYNNEESPKIVKRGIKLNLPFDAKSPTYFSSNNSTASRNAIANVWDLTFWTTWFDEMARYRYNVLSVWNNHPFTSMIKLPDYPNVALNNVTGYSDIYNDNDNTGTVIKTMTIDEKIEFWKKVMAYAKDRGFKFYLVNWNLFLSNAKNQYGLTDGSAGVTNQATITYMRKCMYELLKTYPNLDGFGVTEGEGMISNNDEANSLFLGSTYGKGMADFAKDNPQRKLNFIHRWHMADFTLIKKNFAELFACPNVTFDMSFKYSSAHMYSSVTPEIMSTSNINALKSNNIKTWFTVRNDDFYYHNWGDPNYARTYINNIPGKGDWFTGFYIGSDGFHQTRTFFSKNSVTQGQLEIQRLWYMNMLWGRLAFNPNTPDDVFKNYMSLKYPEVASADLFTAWRKASSGLPKVGEILFGSLNLDFHWYPENCQDKDGFLTIAKFAAANPRSVTTLCGITNSAANNCGSKTSTYNMATQIEADALAALSIVDSMNSSANTELRVAINNIKAMSYLTIYYAYKIRGATYNKANNNAEAINAMSKAYCWWKNYTNLMDANFTGMSCQRVAKFATWHQHDAAVLKEFTDLGGLGIPNCTNANPQVFLSVNFVGGGTVKGDGAYKNNDSVTVTATSNQGFKFDGWKENGNIISTDSIYKFVITSDRFLVANFKNNSGCDLPWNNDIFSVNNGAIQKSFGPIDISCAPNATISFKVESAGNLEPADYCKAYYKIDGGAPVFIGETFGITALRTFTINTTAGSTIELMFDVKNSSGDEFYHIRDISITSRLTSVINPQENDMEIFPNPATNILNVIFLDNKTKRDIKIFNSLGQLVYRTKTDNPTNQIDVKMLCVKGLITIQVETDKTVLNRRILIQ